MQSTKIFTTHFGWHFVSLCISRKFQLLNFIHNYISNALLLTAKPKHRLCRALFLLKTGFLALVLISADLDKSLHTPIVVRNTLVGRLRPRSALGRLQAKPKRLCFCNTCNAP